MHLNNNTLGGRLTIRYVNMTKTMVRYTSFLAYLTIANFPNE